MTKGLPRSLSRAKAIDVACKKLRITVDESMTLTGDSGNAIFQTAVVGGLPEGNILIHGAVSNLTFTGPTSANLADDFQGDYAVGTAPTADTTLNGSEVDIIASTAIPAATSEVSANVRSANATQVIVDNTASTLEVNLNVTLDADEVTDGEDVAVAVTGTIDIVYSVLGDD